jgi:hypothetical protein
MLEKVSCFPNEGTPAVIAGAPQDGDLVRIVGTQQYYRYLTPAVAVPSAPRVFDWAGMNAYLVGLLGGGDAGTAALQALLEAARDRVGTTANDKLTRYFYTWFLGSTSFTKADTAARLVALVATSVVTQNQANAVATNWPSP